MKDKNAKNDLNEIKSKMINMIKEKINNIAFISVEFPYESTYKVDIKVVSNAFLGVSHINRHKAIYEAISELSDSLHAIQITTKTIDETEV